MYAETSSQGFMSHLLGRGRLATVLRRESVRVKLRAQRSEGYEKDSRKVIWPQVCIRGFREAPQLALGEHRRTAVQCAEEP